MLICDKCKAGILEGTKFCSQCGDPVTEADKVLVPVLDSNIANVDIRFGQSSSANYVKAVAICENIPTYIVEGESKNTTHTITLPITEVELLVNLHDLIGSWKSSQMLINGHAATKKDLVYYGVGCFRNRQKSFKPEQFCFGEKEFEANVWGCKRLNMPIMEWGGGWLDYGRFDSKGLWHLDKSRILHDIELGLKESELCPVLDRRRILDTLDKLPNVIDPKNDDNWQYRTNYQEVDGEYKEVALGIRPVIKRLNSYVVGSYKPHWEPSESTIQVPEPKVNIEQHSAYSQSSTPISSGSHSKLWLILGVIFILYLLLR
jgi:RNA polymerase subunit RPABC4/transcription elongation factor Spt4